MVSWRDTSVGLTPDRFWSVWLLADTALSRAYKYQSKTGRGIGWKQSWGGFSGSGPSSWGSGSRGGGGSGGFGGGRSVVVGHRARHQFIDATSLSSIRLPRMDRARRIRQFGII